MNKKVIDDDLIRVLILGSGTQGLAIIRSLSAKGHVVYLLCGKEHNYADGSRFVTKKIYAEASETSADYLNQVIKIILNERIDVIIPMGDASAVFVSKNIERLQQISHIKMPPFNVFLKGYDKNKLMALCANRGYPHPETIDLSMVDIDDDSLKSFKYPAMLKPNCTTGGRGMVEVSSYEEMKEKFSALHLQYGDYHLQRFVKAGGRQVKIQLYVDDNQNLVNSTVMQKIRWYPNKAGSSCCSVSITDTKIVSTCYSILKDIGWVGFADFDAIEDPDTKDLLIMEINPRVPACIQLPIVAGVDWAEIIINGYLDRPQIEYNYKEGEYLRHLGLDVMWFRSAERRWTTRPCWFSFLGKHIHYQDISHWTDPIPFITGTYKNIRNLFNSDFRKAKSVK